MADDRFKAAVPGRLDAAEARLDAVGRRSGALIRPRAVMTARVDERGGLSDDFAGRIDRSVVTARANLGASDKGLGAASGPGRRDMKPEHPEGGN